MSVIGDEDVRHFEEHGYLMVRGVFGEGKLDAMRAAVDRILANARRVGQDQNHRWGGNHLPAEELDQLVLKGFHDVQYHEAAFMQAVTNERIAAVLTRVIGPNVQLHHSKMLVKPPENGAPFPMHQDYPYFPHEQHTMTAASIHLDDTDDENGCLRVIPGSHKWGPLEHASEGSNHLDTREFPVEEGVPCPAKAGDVLFFNYLTVHGSGINRSTRTRRNVLVQYRDPADSPVLQDDGTERHVNWGQGLMVAGTNAEWLVRRPRFRLQRPEPAAV